MKTTTKTASSALVGVLLLLGLHSETKAQSCQINVPPTTPVQRFADHNNGTITDLATGLMWKKCLEGQQGVGCYGKPELYSWELAQQHASMVRSGRFSGYSDWRLPTVNELKTLVEQQCTEPAINLQVFPRMLPAGLWTATASTPNAWSVDFSKGRVFQSLQQGGKYVRLVRNLR